MAWRGGSKGTSQSVSHRKDVSPRLRRTRDTKERWGCFSKELRVGAWAWAQPPKHLSHPSSPLFAHHPHVAKSCCPSFTRKAMESVEWAMAPSPEEGLSWSLFRSSGEEGKVAAKTKVVALPLCPTKRSGLGQPGPCGQPLGAVPKAEEALLFPYGSRPSPTEFPFPSS